MKRFPLAALGFLLLLGGLPAAQQTPAASDEPFLLLTSGRTKDLQVRLTAAAKSGYRVLAILNAVSYENQIFLEKLAQPEPVEYLLLGISRVPTAGRELNQGAEQGFRLLPHAVAMTGELVAIMEKRPGDARRYEYAAIMSTRANTLAKEVQQRIDQGWQVCWLYRPAMQQVAILERPAGSPAPTGKPAEIKDADRRVRFLSPKSFTTFDDELAALASRGTAC